MILEGLGIHSELVVLLLEGSDGLLEGSLGLELQGKALLKLLDLKVIIIEGLPPYNDGIFRQGLELEPGFVLIESHLESQLLNGKE